MVANMHLTGKSVDKDLGQYMYWLGQAADNEYPPANYLLGMAYLYSDKSLAVGYLKKTFLKIVAKRCNQCAINFNFYLMVSKEE
jgi:TPR repeat protein